MPKHVSPLRGRVHRLAIVFGLVSLALVACSDPAREPERLQIDPPSATIDFGGDVTLHAMAVYGSTTENAGPTVTWVTRDATRASLTDHGDGSVTVHGLAPGATTIEAHLGELTATAALTVGAAPMISLAVTPTNPSLARGTTIELTATATYGDSTTGDVSDLASWSSSEPSIATVAAGGAVRALAVGTTVITATRDGVSGTTVVAVTDATMAALSITPTNPSLPKGRTVQLTAMGTFTDNTTQDMSSLVTWSSATPAAVTVADDGLATGADVGASVVSASLGGVTTSTTVTVTPATLVSLAVTPVNPTIARGQRQQFVAIGTYSDTSTQVLTAVVEWSSSNVVVAKVSNVAGTSGEAIGLDPGSAIVTATSGTFTASTMLTVTPAVLTSIAIDPASPSIPAGRTRQLIATGTFSDATTLDLTGAVTWSSSSPAIATVSNAANSRGEVSGLAAGDTVISAVSGAITATTTFTVTAAELVDLDVTPVAPSLAMGRTRQFTAMGRFSDASVVDLTGAVTWSSSVEAHATISNANGSRGLATAVAAGSTQIRATSGAITGTSTLTVTDAELVSIGVTPAAPSLPLGGTQQLTATGVYTDASTLDLTDSVTWSTTAPAVAQVSNAAGSHGLATTLSVGATDVVATLGPIDGRTSLTVTPAVLVSIGVAPAAPTVMAGFDQPFTATGVYSDDTTADLTGGVTWTSSDEAVAVVSNAAGSHGLASALAAGTTQITATAGAITGTTQLTVIEAQLESIEVTPVDASVAAGLTRAFTATGIFANGANRDLTAQVTWSSSDDAIATVSNDPASIGLVTSLTTGTVRITASSGVVEGGAWLTVTDAELASIELAPADLSIPAGLEQPLTATGIFTNGDVQDLTAQVTWTSSDDAIATVSNAEGSQGLVHAAATGTVTIGAELAGIHGLVDVEVTAALLVDLEVSPAATTLTAGLDQAFTATGAFTDGSSLELTEQVTWTSSDEAVATIANAPGSWGTATALAPGVTTITATLDGVSATGELTVVAPVLQAIAVGPADATVAVGLEQPFTASGTYDNGLVLDLTEAVTWSSSDGALATIANVDGERGLARGHAVGDVTITAEQGGVTGTATLHVSGAIVVSIDVSPAGGMLAVGRSEQYAAQATFSDGTTGDVTDLALWSSSDGGVAAVSNAPGSRGLVAALSIGNTVITASLDGVDGNADLGVTAAALDELTIEPLVAPAMPAGTGRDYRASGRFSDGNVRDLTAEVMWTSSDESVLVISNAPGSQGQARGLVPGTVTISATWADVVATATAEVGAAVIQNILVTPPNRFVLAGVEQPYTATAMFTDQTSVDVTQQATWESSDPAVATISNDEGTRGLATTLDVGQTTISATVDGVTGSTHLTVMAAP